MLRTTAFASGLALALALATLPACKGTSSGPPGGTPSSAEVQWHDGGGADLVVGGAALPLPAGEVANAGHPPVMQDESGKRLAFVRPSGDVRLVYLVGSGAYLGPTSKAPVDFGSAPDVDHALGAMFENAGTRRAAFVADVAKDKGDAGIARMLVDGAGVPAKEWEVAFAKLPEAKAAEVKASLASELERGKPTAGLRRAVALVPLREPSRAPALAARLRELADPIREPRASAVMLRALASIDKAQGAAVACEVLGHKPLDTANAKGTPDEIDREGRDALVEASVIAIAAAGTECPHVAALLGDDNCLPAFRCGASGPLTGHETTKQDEPVCTKEQLAQATKQELERSPADVLAITGGTRTPLFVFATLAASNKVPPPFAIGHARRLYALAQAEKPPCESVAPGAACHCEEAIVRDQACRHPEGTSVAAGLCKFEIDDKQKKLLNVVATLPP